MIKIQWKTYAIWILLCEAAGALSGWLSKNGIEIYSEVVAKPAISPPQWVFPIVWGILFALMGIAAARIALSVDSKEKSVGLGLFVTQMMVNFFWPLFFFNAQAYGFALLWLVLLWTLVLATIFVFRKIDKLSAWLLVPYLLWLTFAAVLNAMVWKMNL